jgi:hypothetical protein
MTYNDSDIKKLISCPKEIVIAPKGLKPERGSRRDSFTLKSSDGIYSFNCFIRELVKLPENFSIGLDYNPKDEKGVIKILRCNGLHGGHKEFPHHAHCHIHQATALSINNGLDPTNTAIITNEYTTLSQAIQFFLRYVNVKSADALKYFPPPKLDLFSQ